MGIDDFFDFSESKSGRINYNCSRGCDREEAAKPVNLTSVTKDGKLIIHTPIVGSPVIERRVRATNLPLERIKHNKATTDWGTETNYNGKYKIAGVHIYVAGPFVSLGYAKREPDNKHNPKAVAIYTDSDDKVGYIAEDELIDYYAETGGTDNIPLVMEAHWYNDKLFGWLYTFARNKTEYPYMINQFRYLIKRANR